LKEQFEGWNPIRVGAYFAANEGTYAAARLQSEPLLVFIRPNAVDFAGAGENIGNLSLVFHEALHGITGMIDGELKSFLGIPSNKDSCAIDVKIASRVLSHVAGLNPSMTRPCDYTEPTP
jgi:hypothetical protein